MNQHHKYNHLWSALFFISFLLGGCVSVQLGSGKSQKADEVSFEKPSDPFKSISADSVDQAWQSERTGNTLAFLTECQPSVEASLQTLQTEPLSALTQPVIVKTETKTFNGRESSLVVAEGQIDGIPVSMALLVFKKNGCNFTLSFSGRKSVFQSEFGTFEDFKESFKVR
jgi:hypothetical protein